MKINQIFFSIQGEGPSIGQPAIFIRMSGCNRNCTWCDSNYHKHIDKNLNSQSILNLLIQNPNCNRLIFTGGEPFLQQNEICDFLIKNWLILRNKKIEFETNGSIEIEKSLKTIIDNNLYKFQFNVSPKLYSSGNKSISCLYYQFKEIKEPNNVIFKFVYVKNYFFEITNFVHGVKISPENVFIMPEGATKIEQEFLMDEVVEYCKLYGFTFSPRLHVLIWDIDKTK